MTAGLKSNMGPLRDGGVVVIIGGGPGGAGSAVTLINIARQLGRKIRIVLYEGKMFAGSTHFNQCAGVLSPPIVNLFEGELGLPFPWQLVQKEICGYVLHSEHRDIVLKREGERTYALRRIKFDEYFLDQARKRGLEVIHSRVTDVEFNRDYVMIYSESNNIRADVVIGSFGMDDGAARIFERTTRYRQPRFLSSIVIKVHPGQEYMSRFGSFIHAFLPSLDNIEFGAVTPKMNHLTINIAGFKIKSKAMVAFLKYPPVRRYLPPQFDPEDDAINYFKGRFPFQVSRGFYGDRYVLVGDAAGLLRPFKGKGINMSIITAMKAARTIMTTGISREAFARGYERECSEVIEDIPYGKALRRLAIFGSRAGFLDPVIDLARKDPQLEYALFNCVSANKSFKEIFRETRSLNLVFKLLAALGRNLAARLGNYFKSPKS